MESCPIRARTNSTHGVSRACAPTPSIFPEIHSKRVCDAAEGNVRRLRARVHIVDSGFRYSPPRPQAAHHHLLRSPWLNLSNRRGLQIEDLRLNSQGSGLRDARSAP